MTLTEDKWKGLGIREGISGGFGGINALKISPGNFMEMIFWSKMDDFLEERWMPGLDSFEQSQTLMDMEEKIETSGESHVFPDYDRH